MSLCAILLCAVPTMLLAQTNGRRTPPTRPTRALPSPPATATTAAPVESGEPHWIWAPDQQPGRATKGACYFRKVFQLQSPEQGQIVITCDDAYELYVNGRRVGAGHDWKQVSRFDITRYLAAGRNAVAVKAENLEGSSAGLVARVIVKQVGHTDVAHSTDSSWRVTRQEYSNWFKPLLDDRSWPQARSLGEFGQTAPWGNSVQGAEGATAGRFKIDPKFHVERVAPPDKTGSLIALAFNEWGDLLCSVEQGGVKLLKDSNKDGTFEAPTTYCDLVKNCQGLLPLNGQVYVCGDGPEGAGLYRLSDEDRDQTAEKAELLFGFKEPISEHGPHAIRLGPDGLLYVLVGNHGAPSKETSPTSPYHHHYEGDLVQPRYEDPAGHGAGVKAPGGMVLRTDPDGSIVEVFAGGLRNAYDMCFNEHGELFTADSDNEADEGLPWYRPTRMLHVIPGGEFGWRSGWAAWPEYYPDTLPTVLSTGRGSPTGMVLYQHHRFPESARNAIFMGDWTRGRILIVRMKPSGGTYEATAEVFLEGQPLNVTDLSVGRDGWLYFCTGGRGTEGGIYRVMYDGKLPPQPKQTGIVQALQQPQLESAWSREQMAILKDEMGAQWEKQLHGVLNSPVASGLEMIRALDLMQLLGPYPSPTTLIRLSSSTQPEVRAKAIYLMGIHVTDATNARLEEALSDSDPMVRRAACDALARAEHHAPAAKLLPLLHDKHRTVAYSARLALEQLPVEQWQALVLAHSRPAVLVQGGTALMAVNPDPVAARAVIDRGRQLLQGYLTDEDFLGLTRVLQLALLRGQLTAADLPELGPQLAEEFPSLDARMNRELVRLLAHLDASDAVSRGIETLQGEADLEEKLHLAMHWRFLKSGWTTPRKLAYLEFCEASRSAKGGAGVSRYLESAINDFAGTLAPEEQQQVLAAATKYPTAALPALVKLPVNPGAEMLERLQALDTALEAIDTDAARRLRTGIIAILARSQQPQAFAYLRNEFERVPARRAELAMCLALSPGGENWPLLVQSLAVLEGAAAEDVLGALASVPLAPEDAEPIRQVILTGLRTAEKGSPAAIALLEKWTGQKLSQPDDKWETALAAWQTWFREQYPQQPEPALPVEAEESKWSLEELVTYLNSSEGKQGRPAHGEAVFEKALCNKCHRYGTRGETIGPDLTTVSRRFQKKEVLESVLFPSHVISDQFASRSVVTKDGLTHTGIVGTRGEQELVVLDATGKKTIVSRDNVEEIVPHKKSAMPEGLFNTLTLEEIGDLFAYLYATETSVASKPKK